jgi:hypothetical protein
LPWSMHTALKRNACLAVPVPLDVLLKSQLAQSRVSMMEGGGAGGDGLDIWDMSNAILAITTCSCCSARGFPGLQVSNATRKPSKVRRKPSPVPCSNVMPVQPAIRSAIEGLCQISAQPLLKRPKHATTMAPAHAHAMAMAMPMSLPLGNRVHAQQCGMPVALLRWTNECLGATSGAPSFCAQPYQKF